MINEEHEATRRKIPDGNCVEKQSEMEPCIKTLKDDIEKFRITNGLSLLFSRIELNADKIIETVRSKNEIPEHEKNVSLLVGHATSKTISSLTKQGVDVNSTDSINETLLHHLARTNLKEPIVTLLSHGADVNACDSKRQRPLHLAVQSNQVEIAKLLLEHGAWVNVQDEFEGAPLHYAVMNESLELVSILLARGANVNVNSGPDNTNKWEVNQLGSDSCPRTSQGVVKITFSNETVYESGTKETPLHLACERNNVEIVEILLKNKAKVDAHGSLGRTPLHYAVTRGNLRIVKLLINHGADVNQQSSDGEMPLHLAISQGSAKIMQVLMENGTNLRYMSRWSGGSFMHHAIQCKSVVGVDRLLKFNMAMNWGNSWGLTSLQASLDGPEEIRELILIHLIKLKSAKFYIQPGDIDFVKHTMKNTIRGRNLHTLCMLELDKMKKYYISEFYNFNVHDLLVMRQVQMARFLMKDDVMNNLEQLKHEFPVYYHMLNSRIRWGFRIVQYLNKEFNYVKSLLNRIMWLPNECVLKIMSYIPKYEVRPFLGPDMLDGIEYS